MRDIQVTPGLRSPGLAILREMRTTPPPLVDFGALFPELAAQRTTALRLHPQRADGLAAEASKMGGAIVWPPGEPWPRCASPYCGCGGGRLVTVLQLGREDAPRLPFPEGTDLFQMGRRFCPRRNPRRDLPLTVRPCGRRPHWTPYPPPLDALSALARIDAQLRQLVECGKASGPLAVSKPARSAPPVGTGAERRDQRSMRPRGSERVSSAARGRGR
jgi:hypothetical protein